ncbi:MAG: dihydroorotate dehydrogenase electron transfer subunit, partial [Actinobacteria bacterium]|nr:dihydroorotate dehydrogenase electron transfer subunit [Actinomycetota bacterium]
TARLCKPGQFVNVRLPKNGTELLRLPFSVYGVLQELGAIEIMYQVLGRGTTHMSTLQLGEAVDLIGPIGHGWKVPDSTRRALLVGGGLGTAPLAMLARQLHEGGVEVDIVVGAPCKDRLCAIDCLGCYGTVHVATDDGSEGIKGFSTAISGELLADHTYDYVATCGPEPMQRIVSDQCEKHGVYCQVSLERLMACGIGACLSCVVQTKSGLKRACVDGPVFDGTEVCWDERD